jgi:hypothetical protein
MKCEHNGIVYFQIPEWDPNGLTLHGFFGRVGGVSPPPFDSLNTGTSAGDDPHLVTENLNRIAKLIGTRSDHIIFLRQVHSDTILCITKNAPFFENSPVLDPYGDGICTDRTDLILAVRTADCLPILLLDPIRPAVAIVHAGWRGTLKRILKKCLNEMYRLFDTNPEITRVAFGPGIRSCCFLVDKDVAEYFYEAFPLSNHLVSMACKGKWRVDLYRANACILLEEGVREEHLFYEPLCTSCHKESFFSVRADGEVTGRHLSLVRLKP